MIESDRQRAFLSYEATIRRLHARVRTRARSLVVWSELIRNLAVRDVETRYKHSFLGLYWALINPLVTAAIFSFVFGVIFPSTTSSLGRFPYMVFLLTGLTFWNFFANGTSSASNSITGSAALLAKIYFPRVVLPTAAVLARFIDFLFSLVVLSIFVGIYRLPLHWTAFWVIPLLGIQLAFTLGIGYIVAALNVLYRDVSQLVALVMMMWMYLSPVMYPIKGVPDALRGVLLMNPMGALLQAERDLIFSGRLSAPVTLWTAVAWAAFTLIAGLSLFKRLEPVFAEVM